MTLTIAVLLGLLLYVGCGVLTCVALLRSSDESYEAYNSRYDATPLFGLGLVWPIVALWMAFEVSVDKLSTPRAAAKSETAKAAEDRERELDRRTAAIIRDRGWAVDKARTAALTEYEADMKAATP